MITYQLFKYSGAVDDEEMIYENEDKDSVVDKAITLSENEDGWHIKKYNIGIYTYRMEKCIDGIRSGEWRFFNNGKEITQEIKDAILG